MAKSHLKLVTPATVLRTVTPRRPPNSALRPRAFESSGSSRLPRATAGGIGTRRWFWSLIGTAYGLLRWDQVDFRTATLHVRRVKQGNAQHASDHR
jgi:hypothetical protein